MTKCDFWGFDSHAIWGGGQERHLIWRSGENAILWPSGRGGCQVLVKVVEPWILWCLVLSCLSWVSFLAQCLQRSRLSWSNFLPSLCLCLSPVPCRQRGQTTRSQFSVSIEMGRMYSNQKEDKLVCHHVLRKYLLNTRGCARSNNSDMETRATSTFSQTTRKSDKHDKHCSIS